MPDLALEKRHKPNAEQQVKLMSQHELNTDRKIPKNNLTQDKMLAFYCHRLMRRERDQTRQIGNKRYSQYLDMKNNVLQTRSFSCRGQEPVIL